MNVDIIILIIIILASLVQVYYIYCSSYDMKKEQLVRESNDNL